jgi:hypothetical protein
MRIITLLPLLSLPLIACGGDESSSGPDATISSPDCSPDRLRIAGAVSADTPSVATVKLAGVVIGVGGLTPGAAESYALTLKDILNGELQSPGAHDVATASIKYVTATASANCQQPGQCLGFVALAGTFTVLEASPRYRATFTLDQLHAYDDASPSPGAAIPGTATGCIDAPGT